VLLIAGLTDLLDGVVARAMGSTRLGAFLDPVADKLFMVSAFGVVAYSGMLAWYEIGAVLFRDLVAALAFLATASRHRARSIPARLGGKAVTLLQMLTLGAFLLSLPILRPLAWATGAVAIYAVWDYVQASRKAVEL